MGNPMRYFLLVLATLFSCQDDSSLSTPTQLEEAKPDVQRDVREKSDSGHDAKNVDASLKVDIQQRDIREDFNSDVDPDRDMAISPELEIGDVWTSISFPQQNTNFSASFDMAADESPGHGVIGLSNGFAEAYSHLLANVRFNEQGSIDARDDDGYVAFNPAKPYQANTFVHVKIDINFQNNSYDVEIDQVKQTGLDFRTAIASIGTLQYLNIFSEKGNIRIKNFKINGNQIELKKASKPVVPGTRHVNANFDALALQSFGDLSKSEMESEFGPLIFFKGDHAAIVESSGGGKELRVRYQPTSKGSTRVNFRINIPANDEMWLSYWIKFEEGFEVVKGGKLPGLSGGTHNSGGNKPDGTDGFSARMMWRRAQKMVVYLYHPDQPTIYGEDVEYPNFSIVNDKWYKVRERIVMNTNNTGNGIVQTWIDGQLKVDRNNIRFRSSNNAFSIDSFMFSTFYGGNDASWSPSKTTYIRFDNFKIATAQGGVD